MVFMIISLWAFSKKDEISQRAELQRIAGEKCISETQKEAKEAQLRNQASSEVGKLVVMQFSLLQKSNICHNVVVEINNSRDGFNLYQTTTQELNSSWFADGKHQLNDVAQMCLSKLGALWIDEINKNEVIKKNLEKLLVEGHANSKPFIGETEKMSFLRNLNLSQARSFEAATYLIENLDQPINKGDSKVALRALLVAQGKSYLEPIIENGTENFEKSKRLEFKIILRNSSNVN